MFPLVHSLHGCRNGKACRFLYACSHLSQTQPRMRLVDDHSEAIRIQIHRHQHPSLCRKGDLIHPLRSG